MTQRDESELRIFLESFFETKESLRQVIVYFSFTFKMGETAKFPIRGILNDTHIYFRRIIAITAGIFLKILAKFLSKNTIPKDRKMYLYH